MYGPQPTYRAVDKSLNGGNKMTEQLSQELSKRLDDLGVVVESKYVWGTYHSMLKGKYFVLDICKVPLLCKYFPAPTFTELWAVMPDAIKLEGDDNLYQVELEAYKDVDGSTTIGYIIDGSMQGHMEESFDHESPVEAAGMLLIWLAENGHVKARKIA